MKNVLWIVLLVLGTLIVLIITLTFMQPEFGQPVGVKILFLQTRRVPVYFYIFAAFIAGILLGSLPILVAYIGARREAKRKAGRISELEKRLVAQERKETAEEGIRVLSSGNGRRLDGEKA